MTRTVNELVASVPGARLTGDGTVRVTGLAYDSRRVEGGELFVCWQGLQDDGHRYINEAIRRGAAGLVCERPVQATPGAVLVRVPDARLALGHMAATFYGHPSRRLRTYGVTGTNGKTTTAVLLRCIARAARRPCGLIGTIEAIAGGSGRPALRTTPEASDIQRLLREMADAGDEAAAIEVSSHAVALHRIVGTEFDIGVFTNLTQDHLDFHGTFESYLAVKQGFIASIGNETTKRNKLVAINADDPHADAMLSVVQVPVLRYGRRGNGVDVTAEAVRMRPSGLDFLARTPAGPVEVHMSLTGAFNVYNALAAITAAVGENFPLDAIAEGLAAARVPGRFERIDQGQDFTVVVDYAHTPDGLQNVLEAARRFEPGRLVVVFGAGGDRDRTKRPLMGEVAGRLADEVIITSDNPRSEDPASICQEIEVGLRSAGVSTTRYAVIVDRREAIAQAIGSARPGDLILIAGKGHETYQEIAGERHHFDDREEAARAIEGRRHVQGE